MIVTREMTDVQVLQAVRAQGARLKRERWAYKAKMFWIYLTCGLG